MIRQIALGDFSLHLVSDGLFALDGGAMFGIVPKVLWQRSIVPDEFNRIELGLNCLLIATPNSKILLDTGIGDKLDAKFKDIYAISKSTSLLQSLKSIGTRPEEIDTVVNTHLHFDHAGGNTRESDGEVLPTFPEARYVIQRGEWEDALNPNDRTRGSYLEENLLPVEESGQLELIDGDCEIEKGIRTHVTGGHTPHHQAVFIENVGRTAIYLGDLIPTSHHLKIPWVMGYDLFPIDTVIVKKRIVDRALNERWTLCFEHDPKVGMGYLEMCDGELVLSENL